MEYKQRAWLKNAAIKRTLSSWCDCKYSCILRTVVWVCLEQISIVTVTEDKTKYVVIQLPTNKREPSYFSKEMIDP